jgi:GxxExxY protein
MLPQELSARGLAFARQLHLPFSYRGVATDSNHRLDMLEENCVIIDIKQVETPKSHLP